MGTLVEVMGVAKFIFLVEAVMRDVCRHGCVSVHTWDRRFIGTGEE